MRTHVTFLSEAFNQAEVKENFLNPCCFVESMLPFYKKWLGVTDEGERQAVCTALHEAFSQAGEVSEVRWHDDQDFASGNEEGWRPSPDA